MYAQLVGEFKTGVIERTGRVGAMTTGVYWGISITEIIKVVMRKALELGQEHRTDIENAARAAVDAVVELDLPYIPDGVEDTIDSVTRSTGYAAITAVLDAVLGQVV